MAYWVKIAGIPGPPQHNGWFRVVSYTYKGKETYLGVPGDSSSTRIFEAYVRATPIAKVIVFNEPQLEIIYEECVITQASSSRVFSEVLDFTVNSATFKLNRSAGP